MYTHKGFTLFEVIISITIFAILIGGFGGFVISILNTRTLLRSTQEVDENIRFAAGIINQKIRSATGVNASDSVFGIDSGVLSLSMADASVNPTVFRLDQDNGRLLIQQGSAQPIILTTDEIMISQLIFLLLSGTGERENIGITIEAQTQSLGDSYASFTQRIHTSTSIRQ